jgi:hypothetical protein
MRSLFYGGIGFAAGIALMFLLEARPTGRSEPRAADEHVFDDPVFVEVKELLELEARKRELEAERDMLLAELAARAARRSQPADTPAEIPVAIRDAAAAMRVPDDALRAALDAAATSDPTDESLARLKASGADGFRALVAMLRGGYDFVALGTVFSAAWDPSMAGDERALIEIAETGSYGALAALGLCDTQKTREYLLARLHADAEGRFLHFCAEGLGRMREPRALPDLARAIRSEAPARTTALLAIAEIGGDDARSILIDYIREPDSEPAGAVYALTDLDSDAARKEADALLAGGRALTPGQIRLLKDCLR